MFSFRSLRSSSLLNVQSRAPYPSLDHVVTCIRSRTIEKSLVCSHIRVRSSSSKRQVQSCVQQVCFACICRYFTVKMHMCQAIFFLFISLQQMFSLSLGIVRHCEGLRASAPDIYSLCQTGRSCISQSPNCNIGYSSVIAV